jgi:hypothetical protein
MRIPVALRIAAAAAAAAIVSAGSIPAALATTVNTPAAAPPSGRADVFTSPATLVGIAEAAGTTFTLEVRVDPRSVEVDAASAYVVFDPRYLEVAPGGLVAGSSLDTPIAGSVDNGAGAISYAAGKIAGARPAAEFALAQISFRVKAAPPAALAVDVLARDSSRRPATEVASDGRSVLNAVRGSQLAFGPLPTATSRPSSGSGGSSGGSGSSGGTSGGGSSGGSGSGTRPSSPAPAPGAAPLAPPAAAPLPAPAGALPPPPLAQFAPGVVPPLPAAVRVGAAPVAPAFESSTPSARGCACSAIRSRRRSPRPAY